MEKICSFSNSQQLLADSVIDFEVENIHTIIILLYGDHYKLSIIPSNYGWNILISCVYIIRSIVVLFFIWISCISICIFAWNLSIIKLDLDFCDFIQCIDIKNHCWRLSVSLSMGFSYDYSILVQGKFHLKLNFSIFCDNILRSEVIFFYFNVSISINLPERQLMSMMKNSILKSSFLIEGILNLLMEIFIFDQITGPIDMRSWIWLFSKNMIYCLISDIFCLCLIDFLKSLSNLLIS